jgi:hypothetical protein
MIDLSEYYFGGYFLIRADKPDWESLQTQQFPDKLMSLSECICPLRLSVSWGWLPGNREAALQFGIPETKLAEFIQWCGTGFQVEIDHPSTFYTLDAVRRFITRFLTNTDNLYLVGVGVHKQLATDILSAVGKNEMPTIKQNIEQQVALAKGGTTLGFEVACYGYNDFWDSWLCSGLEVDMRELFGVQTGQFGLIQTREEAQQVYDWIAEDDQRGHRAEPEPYAYWLLVSYPLR